MSININDIKKFLEKQFSDSSRQFDWDNSGGQILSSVKEITKIGFALDPSKHVIAQAVNEGCELLITHHPLFFAPLKKIDTSSPLGFKIKIALENNLNIFSYHTSLDLSDYSLNDYLAGLLEAVPEDFLEYFNSDYYVKFVCFVPKGYENRIIDAIDDAGGGCIGKYSKCTFMVEGTGTFLPGDSTNPFIGKKGELTKTEEYRLETIVLKKDINRVIEKVKKIHPYEEMAYDVYPLELKKANGLGRICSFSEKISFSDFLIKLKQILKLDIVKHNASLDFDLKKFAIVTGSGASLWNRCIQKGVNVLLTGDIKHHDALDAAEAGVTIVDCGHFETERIYMEYLSSAIQKHFDVDTIVLEEKSSIKYFWG